MAKRTPKKLQSCHRPALEALASKCVGDGKSSLYFVSVDGKQAGVVTMKSLAMTLARSLDYEGTSVLIEDSTGVVWENETSVREQRRLAAEEGE